METSMINAMCRCCASEGVFKDVKTTYHWMGEEEIYADMLKECFDVCLFSPEEGSDGGICEVCITQLRNAVNFKKQVLHTEEQFKRHVQNKLFKPSIVKVEVDEDERNDSDDNASAEEGFSGTEYEIPIKKEVPDEPKPKKRAAAAKATTSRAKKAKTEVGEPSTKREPRPRKVKEEPLDAKMDTMTLNQTIKTAAPQVVAFTRTHKHLANITQILKYTNATPISKYGGIGYACCYCKEQFPKPSALKAHTIQSHQNKTNARFMKLSLFEYVVKVDLTNLKCKICDVAINTLEDVMKHLQEAHNKTMYLDIPNHIMPFKFDTDVLTCYMCSNVFNKFKMLQSHMHIHYRNYICDICDAGFVNQSGLSCHRICHQSGTFTCQYCPKFFKNEAYKRTHERVVHLLSNMVHKCPYCSDKFCNSRTKYEHISKVHGIKLNENLKCNACDKVFNSQDSLTIHMKRYHLMERRHQCSECEKRFYSKAMLMEHMICHTGTREFKCDVCLKSYARRKTLTEHMRIHNDDRRFKCEHCGQAFVQKCSWKGHMRAKHMEEMLNDVA